MHAVALTPYLRLMRLDKPIGIWLVFSPAAWAVLLASPTLNLRLLLIMLLGATLIRAAGCILNDMADRELDRHVARTQDRPLASGAISLRAASILLLLLLLAGLALVQCLPLPVLYLALGAVPLIALYPFMKRITWWPQVFLGLTFNFGALIGWAATGASFTPTPFLLYAACFCWTLGYDTVYALQDAADDAVVGIKSTARRVGNAIRPFVTACYGTMLALLLLIGWLHEFPFPYRAGVLGVALQMGWQLRQLSPQHPERAGRLFRSNQWLGLILLVALVATQGQGILP